MKPFDEVEGLPTGFLRSEFRDISTVCPRPTLIHLPGHRRPALFVSILLHGNEDAGLLALQEFFRHQDEKSLPRAMTICVGNVEACRLGVRFTQDQIDFNRAWPGSDLPHTPTHDLLAGIRDCMVQRGVFASIDIHNNTGRNPLYGCICSLEPQHALLASLFSEKIIYFTRPKGVQTQAFVEHCPSVTLECGQIGDLQGAHAAAEMLEKCMVCEDFSQTAHSRSCSVFQSLARIQVRDECTIGFEPGTDVVLREDLDLLNFRDLPAGEALGTVAASLEDCFVVNDQDGNDVTAEYLSTTNGQVVFRRSVIPSMLTRDLSVMRQDCLGYLMESLSAADLASRSARQEIKQ